MMTIVAQGIGLVAMAANVLAYQFKSRKSIILCQLFGALLFAVNMFMLGATIGGILNILAFFRALVYIKKDALKLPVKALNTLFLLLFVLFYVLVFTVFGKEPSAKNLAVELLPVIGMGAMTVGLSKNTPRAIRLAGFINSPCWLIYDCVSFSLGGILCEVFSIASVISALWRIDVRAKKEERGVGK